MCPFISNLHLPYTHFYSLDPDLQKHEREFGDPGLGDVIFLLTLVHSPGVSGRGDQ